jgi:DnaK suppressor protein
MFPKDREIRIMSKNFTADFLNQQKKLLLTFKEQIVASLKENSGEELHIRSEDLSEDGDLAQTTLNQTLAIGLKEKELFKLREIEAALRRIEDGTYGFCEETDERISEGRLKKIPWTRYSIQAAEEIERNSQQFRRAS